jgi:phage gpG-like protein
MLKLSLKVSKIDLSKITDEVKQKAFGKEQMKAFMEKLIVDIKKRTRGVKGAGYGVSKDFGKQEKLADLSQGYIDYRKGKLQFYAGKHGQVYTIKSTKKKKLSVPPDFNKKITSASRSGLTFSGQMLDAMTAGSSGALKGEITLKDARKPYKGAKKTPTNNQLADWHEQGAGKLPKRPFMHVSDMEYKRVVQDMQKQLNQVLKKIKL